MVRQSEQGVDSFVQRHLSQLKILGRVLEHELNAAKSGPSLALERELVENLLDLVDIFVDDLESAVGGQRRERDLKPTASEGKATVTRLN
ncbi:MAG: hypothetical protein AAF628_25745 [Planctomycetota bacterium]